MGRPISLRTIHILETLEEMGPSSCSALCKKAYGGDPRQGSKYLCRAEDCGCLTSEVINCKKIYTVAPGWRARLLNAPGHGFMPMAKFRPPPEHELQRCWRVCDDTT